MSEDGSSEKIGLNDVYIYIYIHTYIRMCLYIYFQFICTYVCVCVQTGFFRPKERLIMKYCSNELSGHCNELSSSSSSSSSSPSSSSSSSIINHQSSIIINTKMEDMFVSSMVSLENSKKVDPCKAADSGRSGEDSQDQWMGPKTEWRGLGDWGSLVHNNSQPSTKISY